ncbi:hypothetical protein [Terricaulis sp.]|uniref:hypothetical protein n=1 Tax=Terricaulis sp. TaxID=2768686 RepID=UPI0037830BC0
MRRVFLAGLLSLAIASCATPAPAQVQRFSGTFDWHFETSSFRPDDGGGPYWLSADGDAFEQIAAPLGHADRGTWGRFHIVVEARLSPEGRYGHMGGYRRELHVTRVIETRLIASRQNP